VNSKADDFDVRYRDVGTARHGRPAANGGYRGNAGDVDYDLGYDAEGWDTQGFRRPEVDHLGSDEPGYAGGIAAGAASSSAASSSAASSGPANRGPASGAIGTAVRALRSRREGSHARTAGAEATSQLGLESDATEGLWAPEAPGRGSRGNHGGGPSGPDGPNGPRGPRRPRGLRGFGGPGRRGLDGPRVKVKGSWWRHWTWRKVVGVLLAAIGAVIVLGAIAIVMIYEQTPVPTAAMAATGYSQSVVYSGNGTVIGRFGTTNRQMLTYGQLQQSQPLIDAVLAAEDRNFFTEGGVSPTGIARAAYADLRGSNGSLQGGSTITQEFVRQYYSGIGTQQTLTRKIKEIFVAMKVAKEKSKQWILTNYLNTIYLGDGAYGVGAAAETYYGKPVSKLDVAQAAVIAAIIQQPSTYPLAQYRPELINRWHYVLNGMVLMGKLSAQRAQTMKFPVPGNYVPQTVGSEVWDPYILNMVYNELVDVYHFSQSQIYNGGYVIRTSIDDAKMAQLYQAVRDNEAQINAGGVHPFDPTYMHAGAVLENPADGSIQAMYPGPGYPGAKYNGTGKVITQSYCKKIACEVNMAVYNREQVGSSFKPYILSTAVKQGMNVQTSTLDGYNNSCIPPDSLPSAYPEPAIPTTPLLTCQTANYYPVHNDSAGENGPYTPQMAMAVSINTAYADLWHTVAGVHGTNVVQMAQAFGVNTDAAGITAGPVMEDQAGTALGQGSLTVGEQATMLATIADNGVYHDAHVITKITQNNAPPTPIKITSYPVFSANPILNTDEATQVQWAMSADTQPYGTAPTAGLSNGQEIIAKTGTTNTAQSAFFIGAMPSQALAVALFTNEQGKGNQTLDMLGGNSQGGFGGTWPAAIWHTYAQNQFVPLGIEQFTTPVFTGSAWNQVPPGLRKVAKKHKKVNHDQNNDNNGNNGNPFGQPGQGGGNPNPFPTYTCDPTVVTCGGAGGTGQSVNATPVGAAAGVFAGLPATALWVRHRRRRR
jgi:membrane peptidoglycan carboxypeptidase